MAAPIAPSLPTSVALRTGTDAAGTSTPSAPGEADADSARTLPHRLRRHASDALQAPWQPGLDVTTMVGRCWVGGTPNRLWVPPGQVTMPDGDGAEHDGEAADGGRSPALPTGGASTPSEVEEGGGGPPPFGPLRRGPGLPNVPDPDRPDGALLLAFARINVLERVVVDLANHAWSTVEGLAAQILYAESIAATWDEPDMVRALGTLSQHDDPAVIPVATALSRVTAKFREYADLTYMLLHLLAPGADGAEAGEQQARFISAAKGTLTHLSNDAFSIGRALHPRLVEATQEHPASATPDPEAALREFELQLPMDGEILLRVMDWYVFENLEQLVSTVQGLDPEGPDRLAAIERAFRAAVQLTMRLEHAVNALEGYALWGAPNPMDDESGVMEAAYDALQHVKESLAVEWIRLRLPAHAQHLALPNTDCQREVIGFLAQAQRASAAVRARVERLPG